MQKQTPNAPPSGLTLPGVQKNRAIEFLVKEYRANCEFVEDFETLFLSYKGVLNRLGRAKAWPNGPNPFGQEIDNLSRWWHSVLEYKMWRDVLPIALVDEAQSLADRWGLHAPWGAGLVIQGAVNCTIGFSQFRFVWSIHYTPKQVAVRWTPLAGQVRGQIKIVDCPYRPQC